MRLAVLAAALCLAVARRLAAVARAAVFRLRLRCRRPWALGVRWCKPPHDGCHPWSLASTSICSENCYFQRGHVCGCAAVGYVPPGVSASPWPGLPLVLSRLLVT
eukprot:scaffold67625_cov44-Phaeocystis_antarctica.AAC.1